MEKSGGIGGGTNGKSSDGFIDRSKVRIMLCDNDPKSLEQVFTLLCKCSYQVTSVRSPRQVIDALNAEGPDIDIILSEVDLPMAKGLKMLKYITRDKDLRRIPVIMMSAQDEISVVVKCLRLGAADYLVKPLRTNELLNLWTHMWRRRRMLGLAEKNLLSYDFDLVASDVSDPNTNSTTLLSDDTDDKSKKNANPVLGASGLQEDESIAVANLEAPDSQPNVPENIDLQTGHYYPSGPKKSELKIGESSAFFTYVKSSIIKNSSHQGPLGCENVAQGIRTEENLQAWRNEVNNIVHGAGNGVSWENHSKGDERPASDSVPGSHSMERSSTSPVASEFPHQRNSKEADLSQMAAHRNDERRIEVPDFPPPYSSYQYYMPQMPNHAPQSMLSQYNFRQYHPQVGGMASIPYYPVSLCLQPGQMPGSHPWASTGGSPSSEVKLGTKVDRREAALIKFRQKRKERCFDKKIRYVNRKRLAERRPRMRGQFVRKMNGVNVDLNGKPDVDFNEDEEEEYEEGASRDSFPENDGSDCQYQVGSY